MKKSIIAVQGTSHLGKTETLNILIDLLSCVAYEYEIKKYNESTNDRRAVFTIAEKKSVYVPQVTMKKRLLIILLS